MSRFDPRGHVNRALLVGVSDYDHTRPAEPDGVPGDLPGVRHNLDRLRDVLSGGGVFGADEITVARSPSLDDFSEELRRAAHEAEGLLLLYFAGHGAVPSAGNELFLQMRNARVVAGGWAVFPGAAQFTGVLTELAGSDVERIVVILDCCYAGNAARIFQDFADHHAVDRRKLLLLMSVQANRLVHAGDGTVPTPFTDELLHLAGRDGALWFQDLCGALPGRMTAAGRTTTLGEPQEPQRAGDPHTDVLLAARGTPRPVPVPARSADSANPKRAQGRSGKERLALLTPWRTGRAPVFRPLADELRAAARWFRRGRPGLRTALSAVLVVAVSGLGWFLLGPDDDHTCATPLELRVLTDPDLESTVRAATDAYLTSDANTTGHGCRRSGLTVYSAGSADAVDALREDTDAWQEPVAEDDNPQRDVGPQPDVWIPASTTDVTRVTGGRQGRVYAELERDDRPFVYSPVVLAVPRDLAGPLRERRDRPLSLLIDDLRRRDPDAEVRRPDPEFTTSALLATLGLYDGAGDPGEAERRLAPGAPAPKAADLLCALPDDADTDRTTAALAPEFLLKSGVGCRQAIRTPRLAAYPTDVPGLTPTFVRVRWKDADLDVTARDDAVRRFHTWLTDGDGLTVFRDAGFRSAAGDRPLLDADHLGTGVLRDPGRAAGDTGRTDMDTALTRYRGASGPGRVLYLLDNSGSMAGLWEGASGGPGILKQSLGGLGDQDQYGVWTVSGTSGARHDVRLPFGHHRRADAERVLDPRRTTVRDAEADPRTALLAAFDDMAGRGADDDGPQLIVFLTDDEDNGGLTGGKRAEVLTRARQAKVPVVMVSLDSGACDRGRADADIAEASGGRCLDASDDLGAALHDEVARAGTGED
ncbi:substrate-binding domain-containing protein [Streptomyces phaeofaciens]|uniref:substrate-binding domain-containing protein n=1 Tax=Streptomyces phaeofaciens TaxID=68254 RepID=UPI0036BA5E5A